MMVTVAVVANSEPIDQTFAGPSSTIMAMKGSREC
jgi:hypothetical protein